MKQQHLFIDADDTLWSNAVLFDNALEDWLNLMETHGAKRNQAHLLFTELESRGFRRGWYGSRRLAINMKAAARRLLGQDMVRGVPPLIDQIVTRVSHPDVLIFDGVHETLETLSEHHTLFLVTMGEKSEQLGKIKGSGLGNHFDAIHVLADKTRSTYTELLRLHKLARRSTWMIGNSLVKDIRPASAAGLRTCHLDHGHDFNFGQSTHGIQPDLVIENFPQLKLHFAGESP